MSNAKKILFPTDFSKVSENAFQHAMNWALVNHADIRVITVYNPYIPMSEYTFAGAGVVADIDTDIDTKLKVFVEKGIMKSGLKPNNGFFPTITSSQEFGISENTICQLAEDEKFDFIIMGTRGESHDVWDKVLGTVSHHVLENAPCPVLLIPPKSLYKRINNVMYAADLKATQPYRIWQSYELLKHFAPNFDCVHVSTGEVESNDMYLFELDNYFKKGHPDIPIQFHLIHLESVEEGIKFASNRWDSDLVLYVHSSS